MSKQTIRPYEMSLWTLQDSFITVLKSLNVSQKGHIQEPVITIKTDGTQELNFSIPMYIFNGKELVENPIWYNVINGTLIANLRKIKIIFNKGNKELEKIYEFVIEKVTETHQDGMLMCEVMGTGLAFQELGKSGYKIYFGLDEFEEEYANWFEQENPNKDEEPVANIDYWAKKLVEGTNWDYEVQMDWSAYDGITNDSLRTSEDRQPNKVYEDEYIASWDATTGSLTPTRYESYQEKARIVSAEKSNRYNISQTIAETFGVFCRYQYEYDDNYHIIGRKIIFYNTFLDEKSGKMDIEYPYHTNSIKRELDSADVTTVLYVTPIADSSTASGLITIADVEANRTYDDFILNFDYLYSIGTISQEQYDNISEYETALYILNHKLSPIQNRINEIDLTLADAKGRLTIAEDAISLAREEVASANAMIRAQVGEDGILERTDGNPAQAVLLSSSDGYYVKVAQEGVYGDTLHLYESYENGKVANEIKSFKIVRDEFGNISRLTGLYYNEELKNSKFRYLTYQYRPNSHYEKIRDHYNLVISSKEAEAQELNKLVNDLEDELVSLQEELNTLLEEKNKLNGNFERLMGPALREGSWQADEYTNYGQKGRETVSAIGNKGSDLVTSIWDTETLDDSEQKSYYESSTNQNIEYYVVIDIENYVNTLIAAGLKNIFLNQRDSSGKIIYQAGINSDLYYAFYKSGSHIKPGIIIADEKFNLANGKISLDQVGLTDDNGAFLQTIKTIIPYENISYIDIINNYTQVYPRIIINSDLAQTTSDSLIIKNAASQTLEKYYDYSVLLKELIPYITLKSETVLTNTSSQVSNGLLGGYTISYTLTNASLALYLDALEVSRENAYPKASYEVELNVFNEELLKAAYNLLGKISHINDHELHFENVQGYISELTLSLDKPWEDKFVIQNYKTKFEDLFSRIVASSEQMKTNALVYDRAASAFDSNGALKKENIQLTLNQSDLNYSFANGTLTINEKDGIWGVSDSGVVAFRGGGIFTANKVDAVGNWIWNSGITPNGINAALLTAGQIDTNLIKIYAGDNVKFQLNADGLFAYRSNADGTSIANNYVVHNSEGLFLAAPINRIDEEGKETSGTYNQVEVSWDGFIIRNSKEEKVFYADDEGNLTLAGYIYASGGEIGGWGLDKTSLFSLGNTVDENGNIIKGIEGGVGMASAARVNEDLTIDEHTINDDGTYIVFWAGRNHDKINTDTNLYDDKFQVLSDGTLKASGVVIEGTINATGGKIGNLTIQEVEDGAKGTSSIQLVALQGNIFHLSTITNNGNLITNPETLTFNIKYNGSLADKKPNVLKLYRSANGEDYQEFNPLDFTPSSLTLSYNDATFNGSQNTTHFKLVAIFGTEEYESYTSIYVVKDGEKGEDGLDATDTRYWLEFVDYDNYYRWYKTEDIVVGDDSVKFDFSPTQMKVAIAYTEDGIKTYKEQTSEGYKVSFYGKVGTEWNLLNSSLEENIYAILDLTSSNHTWDYSQIKVSILSNGLEVFSEVKYIAWGTSAEAAKFDFLASGAYWTTGGLNYTFNDTGFKILSAEINEENQVVEGTIETVFEVDETGNLQLTGTIKATTGNIGKWEIGENGISSSNSNFITGITATEQSIYYDNFDITNIDMLNFLNITDAGKDSSGNYSLSEAIRVSVGTQPVFYSGIKEQNRLGLYNNNGEWKVFEAGNTYTYSVLADGLVYAKNLALDGSLFVSNTISFLDIENKAIDRHIFSVKENTSLNIIDPTYGVPEQVFFGVEKISDGYTPYNFAISHKGNISIADGEIFIGTSGLFITSRKDGLPYRLASGFNTNVSDQDSTPFLWAASFLETNSLEDISLDNTAFYISGTGTTFAKNIYTEQIKGDTFTTSSLRLIKNTKDITIKRLIIDDNESYIDNNGNIVFNPLFTKELWITGNPENKENGLLISYNSETQEAIFSGLNSGSNTFNLSSTGIGSFIRLEADEFRTSRFTTEEIGTINGSMLISNNLRYLSYTRAANEITFTTEEAVTNVNKYDLIDIEFHNNPCRMVVTEIGEDQKTIVGYLLSNPPSDIPSQGLLFIIGVLKLLVRIKTIEENTITLTTEINENINNSFVQEMLEKYISVYNQFTFDGYSINGTIQKVNDESSDWLFSANNDGSIPTIDEIVYLQSAQGSQSYSRIYLRALDETPEIIFYRSLHLEDNPNVNHYAPATHLNKSSLVLKIGNLEDIIDPDFSEISLSGSGLYGENVYLKGSLVLPSAGITNDSSVNFNYSEWISENSNKVSLDENDTSPIRFWAGAPGVNRKKAPLVITENGSLYATQGVFQGQIIATNGIFSGYITSTGVILDSSVSNFYFAKSPTNGEEITLNDYIIDVTADNGLEIYDDGFCVFSGIERPLDGDIYLDYSNNSNTGFKYQFPYVSAKQDEKTLIAYNINTLQFEANISSDDSVPATFFGMKQTANSLEWYGAITPLTLQGNDATNAWRDYYEQALSPTKQQSYYAIKVNNGEFNLGPELEDLQFTFSNNNLKFNTGNCIIESVNGGINIKVLDEN